MRKTFLIIVCILQFGYSNDKFYYQNHQKIYLSPYNNLLRSNPDIDYYQNENGVVLGVTDKLIVKIKDGVLIESLLLNFNLFIEKNIDKNLYLLKVDNKNNTIDISNKLNENENIEYAQPDFVKQKFNR